MLYALHEAAYRTATPLSVAAHWTRDFWGSPLNVAGDTGLARNLYASADLLANLTRRYGRPAWSIPAVSIAGASIPVTSEVAWASPWVTLRRFRRDAGALRSAGC
jgi:poly(3-hydroxybutyrate) depolymerase